MSKKYDAAAIEVLQGLDPVQQLPGMYTDTSRPNHLAQEVLDNSVDEALAGHARHIKLTHYADGSLEVEDDGRGGGRVDDKVRFAHATRYDPFGSCRKVKTTAGG